MAGLPRNNGIVAAEPPLADSGPSLGSSAAGAAPTTTGHEDDPDTMLAATVVTPAIPAHSVGASPAKIVPSRVITADVLPPTPPPEPPPDPVLSATVL